MPKKISKEEANYKGQTTDSQHCSVCTMFVPPSGCTAVKGDIAPGGWCRLFERASVGKAAKMTEFSFFMPIAKLSKEADGSCIVSGYASTPTKDSDGEIVTLGAIKKALPDYMRWRNIREMHQLKAVGKAQEANIDTKGLWLSARISDPVAVQKCVDEVYQGFSIGGRKIDTEGNKIKEIELTEISIVDRPANPDARFSIAKNDKSLTKEDLTLLIPAPPKRTPEQKALLKMAKALTKAGPPAAHDGFSLPAKTAANASPKDEDTQNNKSAGEKCEKHGVVDCKECMEKREFDAKERQAAADSGEALPDGSFPIKNVSDLHNAIQAFGRAKDKAKAKAHIRARAKALNAESELPPKWSKDKTAKKTKKLAKMRLAQALDISGDSFLYLKKTKEAEPLVKGMGTAGQLAYCFDSIRSAQRSLMMEAKREGGDMKDKALAKQLGSISQQLATIISQKAEHEGGEALDLSDVDDQYLTSILGEDFDMDKTQKTVGGSGDPLADALRGMLAKAAQPTRAMRLNMAKGEVKKARKACKNARQAIEEAHKMHKAAYMAKAAKKADEKPDADTFDHQGAMEKLQKAYAEIDKARTFAKAANAQIAKAGRSGQRGQEAGDPESPFYEVPAGVKDLTPEAMASASPGGAGGGSMPPMYPADGSVYAGKADTSVDLRKFASKDGTVPAAVTELLMEKARADGEVEALRRIPMGGNANRRPYSFDMNKIVGGTGGAGDTREMNKALFEGVDPMALGSADERAHTEASARVIGNLITSGRFGKSVFDPAFKGAAGSR